MEAHPSEWEVDELYLVALQDHEELFPISDEAYAEELQLQEILFPASPAAPSTSTNSEVYLSKKREIEENGESSVTVRIVEEDGESFGKFCSICMDKKPSEEFFTTPNCAHSFCIDCTSKYVATKIQENISVVKCPDSKCEGVMSPSECREIVPKEVVERWDKALVESLMLVSGATLYCPFKECSALLLNDKAVAGSAECPSCHRLFCTHCNAAWHQGLLCTEFQALSEADPTHEDLSAVRLAKEKEWRRCPNCFFYVDKESGCLHITCRCAYEFCYRCGSKWSSTHGCH